MFVWHLYMHCICQFHPRLKKDLSQDWHSAKVQGDMSDERRKVFRLSPLNHIWAQTFQGTGKWKVVPCTCWYCAVIRAYPVLYTLWVRRTVAIEDMIHTDQVLDYRRGDYTGTRKAFQSKHRPQYTGCTMGWFLHSALGVQIRISVIIIKYVFNCLSLMSVWRG